MGRLHLVCLDSGKIYSCKHCETHLALCEDIVSKTFNCRHGKAYLFNKVVNVSVGHNEERLMTTGMHTVADIFCVGCGSILGWKYEVAHEKTQKYKEGKFILERCFGFHRNHHAHTNVTVHIKVEDESYCPHPMTWCGTLVIPKKRVGRVIKPAWGQKLCKGLPRTSQGSIGHS